MYIDINSTVRSSLVSIIIPCHNAGRWVAETINSAIDQTHPNMEVVVIDDGSTDNSYEVIKGFGDRVRCESQPNRGACAARNRGAQISTGEFLLFLDADDLLHPETVERQLSVLEGKPNGIAMCLRWDVPADTAPWSTCPTIPETAPETFDSGLEFLIAAGMNEIQAVRDLSPSFRVGHCSTTCWLVPRKIFDEAGGWDEELAICQDNDFALRLCLNASSVTSHSFIGYQYRAPGASSISQGRSARHLKSFLQYCERRERALGVDNSLEARIVAAKTYYRLLEVADKLDPDIARVAVSRIKSLGVPSGRMCQNPRTALIARFFGPTVAVRAVSCFRKARRAVFR